MSQLQPENPHPLAWQFQPVPASHDLRRDGLAKTYFNMLSGDVVVVPDATMHQDYEFVEQAAQERLFMGSVHHDEARQPVGVRFPEDANLLPLSSIINANLHLEMGAAEAPGEITRAIHLSAKALDTAEQRIGRIPKMDNLEGFAISQTTGEVVFLPPYDTTNQLTPEEMVRNIAQGVETRGVHHQVGQFLLHTLAHAATDLRNVADQRRRNQLGTEG